MTRGKENTKENRKKETETVDLGSSTAQFFFSRSSFHLPALSVVAPMVTIRDRGLSMRSMTLFVVPGFRGGDETCGRCTWFLSLICPMLKALGEFLFLGEQEKGNDGLLAPLNQIPLSNAVTSKDCPSSVRDSGVESGLRSLLGPEPGSRRRSWLQP